MLTRSAAEVGTAVATGGLGITVMVGALEFGIGWGSSGPGPGAFPFYMGLLITGASVANLVQATLKRSSPPQLYFDAEQAARVLSFFVPVVLFVAASLFLGIYVATALYLTFTMSVQGGYRLLTAATTGIAAAVFFFVVLEYFFQVPLLKGPLEDAVGLH